LCKELSLTQLREFEKNVFWRLIRNWIREDIDENLRELERESQDFEKPNTEAAVRYIGGTIWVLRTVLRKPERLALLIEEAQEHAEEEEE
jgi:hypothetical protein